MFLGSGKKVEDLIIRHLARQPGRTALELQKAVSAAKGSCSLKAVYKALGGLVDDGAVMGANGRFALRLSWLAELLSFGQEAFDRGVETLDRSGILPCEGGRQDWMFTNLNQLHSFNMQLLFILLSKMPGKAFFDWIPHPWFCLVEPKREAQYLKLTRRADVRFYRVVGGDTFLDHLPEADWKKEAGALSYDPGSLPFKMNTWLLVVEDFILTTRLDAHTLQEVESLFATTRRVSDLNALRVGNVLSRRGRIRLKLENNPRSAAALRKRFTRHFTA